MKSANRSLKRSALVVMVSLALACCCAIPALAALVNAAPADSSQGGALRSAALVYQADDVHVAPCEDGSQWLYEQRADGAYLVGYVPAGDPPAHLTLPGQLVYEVEVESDDPTPVEGDSVSDEGEEPSDPAGSDEPAQPDEPPAPEPVTETVTVDIVGVANGPLEARDTITVSCWNGYASITVGEGITVIDERAFVNCDTLTAFDFEQDTAVTDIGAGAFEGSGIASIEVPRRVSLVRSATFQGCANLTSVTFAQNSQLLAIAPDAFRGSGLVSLCIPRGVTIIEAGTFQGISSLTSVTFEAGSALTSIAPGAFAGTSLASICIPKGVTALAASTFEGVSSLREVTFEADSRLMTIGANAFAGTSLEAFSMPRRVTAVGEHVFAGLPSLTAIEFPDDSAVNFIAAGAFAGTSLQSIRIPRGVETIEADTFKGVGSLTSVTFQDGSVLTSIVPGAFAGTSILNIRIPKGVATLQPGTFQDIESLVLVGFEDDSKLTSIGAGAFKGSGLASLYVPRLVTSLNEGQLEGCSHLKYLTFAAGSQLASFADGLFQDHTELQNVMFVGSSQLTSIGANAFAHCKKLQGVTFYGDSQLASIGDNAFSGCTELKTFEFKEGACLASIGSRAFANTALESFRMPDTLTHVDPLAFLFCDNLQDLYFSAQLEASYTESGTGKTRYYLNPLYGVFFARLHVPDDSLNYKPMDGYGSLLSNDGTVYYTFTYDKESSPVAVKVPDDVKEIAESAFANNMGVKSVSFPSSMTSIGRYAFMYSGIVSVRIPNTVTYLGSECFEECENLAKVVFEEGFTNLAYRNAASQFRGCANLTSVKFPSSLTALSSRCFMESGITQANLKNTKLTAIPASAFAYCTQLEAVTLPDTVTTLADSCFMATGISKVKIPASVTAIESRAFASVEVEDPSTQATTVLGKLSQVKGCAGVKRISTSAFRTYSPLTFEFGDALEVIEKGAFSDYLVTAYPAYMELQGDGARYRVDERFAITGQKYDETAFELVKAINEIRAERGLDALLLDSDLMSAAGTRIFELAVRYPSSNDAKHTRPLGVSYKTISSKVMDELFAVGYSGWSPESSAQSVLNAWMSGDGRDVLYDTNYKTMGVGCFLHGGTLYWDVLFGVETDQGKVIEGGGGSDEDDPTTYAVRVKLEQGFPAFRAYASGDVANLKPGDSSILTITCNNKSNYSDGIVPVSLFKFATSNASIATVNSAGKVTFKQGGKVTIYGYLADTELTQGYFASYTFKVQPETDLAKARVSGIKNKKYTGKPCKQNPTVVLGGVTLTKGVDYKIKYARNVEVGKATYKIVPVKGTDFTGAYQGTFKITKGKQPLTATASDVKLAQADVQAADQVVKPVTVENAAGKVTYRNASTHALAKELAVDAKTGAVTVAQGSGAGTYKMLVNVTAAGDDHYKKGTVTVAFKIKVK